MIQSLAAGLNTGYSVENAVRETQKELMMVYPKEEVISKELAVMTRKLRLSMSMEQVFDEFARRVDMEDVRNFSVVFTAAKKSGGDMIAIIRNHCGSDQRKNRGKEGDRNTSCGKEI